MCIIITSHLKWTDKSVKMRTYVFGKAAIFYTNSISDFSCSECCSRYRVIAAAFAIRVLYAFSRKKITSLVLSSESKKITHEIMHGKLEDASFVV